MLGLLGDHGLRWLGAAAALQLLERLLVPAAAVVVTSRGREATVAALSVLAGVAFLHRAAGGALRVHARATVLQALTSALLSDREGIADSVSPEAEVSLVEGMEAAERAVGQGAPELIGDAPACALLAVFVFLHEQAFVVLGGGAAVVAGAAAVVLVRKMTAAHADRVWQAFLPALDDLVTAIQGRLEVVGNGGEARLLEEQAQKLADWRTRSRTAGAVGFLAGRVPAVAAAATAGLLLLWHGGWGDTSLASAALLASAVPPFARLARGTLDLARDLARARPVVLCLEKAHAAIDEGHAEISSPAEVVWSGVSFSYPRQAAPTLEAVDAEWRPGELLAMAGRNGSGKSTLVRLLLGMHPPTDGEITVGGVSVRLLDSPAFRRHVGYLVQRPFLPDRMTIGEAIHLLAPDASPAATHATLTRLGLWPVLARRVGGAPLDVKLGALSAGEKQRVAIARVLLRDAPMLLLDEPDANLDAEGVALVADVLREAMTTRMVLFIAHTPGCSRAPTVSCAWKVAAS